MDIAVIIPTYHRPHTLARALDSVLSQILKPAEIVVVMDGCADLECVPCTVTRRLCADREVKIVKLNRGHRKDGGAACRNKGIELTTAPYLAYLDDDNYWRDDHLATLARLLELNPPVSFAISGIAFIHDGGVLMNAPCRRPRNMQIDSSGILHKRELIEEYGPWGGPGLLDEDWELITRWLRGGEPWTATLLPTLNYVVRNPRKWALHYGKNRILRSLGLEIHRVRP